MYETLLIRLLIYSDCVVDFCPHCTLACHHVLTALNKIKDKIYFAESYCSGYKLQRMRFEVAVWIRVHGFSKLKLLAMEVIDSKLVCTCLFHT